MRKKILLFKIFLLITFSLVSVGLFAQKGSGQTKIYRDTIKENNDSTSGKINLPYNVSTPAKYTTASTSVVLNADLIKSPAVNVLNALTGRIAGLYTQQNSGQPNADAVSLTLRGRTPLIIIDGIPRPITNMDLEEIESITVLKDAMGTALLGVRGANGAVLITTRQGSATRQQISFTAQTAFQQPLNMPSALNAFDYATLRNEAVNNELSVNPLFNTSLKYSAADLQAFKDHSDPFGHPDIDWRNQILRSSAQLNRYTLNVSGGSSSVKYFGTIEHLYQDGLFITSSDNTYNTNNYLSSYLIRSNVDINLSPKLTGGIHLYGRIGNQNEPGSTGVSIFNSFLTTPNNAYPVLNPNGSYAGTSVFPTNIQGQATGSGYLQSFSRDIIGDFYIKRTLNEITPGLYVKALVSYESYLTENLNRSKPVVAFQRSVSSGGVESYGNALTTAAVQLNTNSISNSSGIPGVGQGRQSYAEVSAGYNRNFNNRHNIDIVILANSENNYYGANLPYTVAGFSGRAAYTFKEKYTAEFAAAYNGSNYYNTSSHYNLGFFPAIGLGWDIAKEDFLKNTSWISALKLSANYGRTGNDNPGYFSYIQRINATPTLPYFGVSPGATPDLVEQTLANPNVTYEKADKLDITLQGSVINNKLGFAVDYYDNRFSDVLIQRGTNTNLIGNVYPNENIGKYKYTGFDFQLTWQQPAKNGFSYYISANAGLQQSKVLYTGEPTQAYPWLQRTGQKVGQAFGYIADGLFQNQAEVDNVKQSGDAVVAGYKAQPGDIKYKDLNGDGIINQFDQAPIGPTAPLITYGMNLGFTYKFVDFSALLQGVANYNVYLNGNSYWEFQNNGFGQAYQQQLGRFTPATAATATYPRLSIGNNVNNDTFSTYWYRKADYLRLRNIEIGFTLPSRYANRISLKSLRIFANGTNVFTLTKLPSGLDPEIYNGSYPLQRLFNLGVNIKL